MVLSEHRRLPSLISTWCGMHEDEWSVLVAVEVRTLVLQPECALPDVIVTMPRRSMGRDERISSR